MTEKKKKEKKPKARSAVVKLKPKGLSVDTRFQKGNTCAAGLQNSGAPEKYTDEFIKNEAKAFREWARKPDSLYQIDFTLERGYGRQRVSEFVRACSEFSVVYEEWLEIQESKFLKLGLIKQHDSQLTKFVLINKHKWHDSQQINATVEQKPYVKDDV